MLMYAKYNLISEQFEVCRSIVPRKETELSNVCILYSDLIVMRWRLYTYIEAIVWKLKYKYKISVNVCGTVRVHIHKRNTDQTQVW